MQAFLSAFSPVRNLRQLFVRPASSLPVLDGFRAFSMILVLLFHTFAIYASVHPDLEITDLVVMGGFATGLAWNGDKGVDIFFVISGFLITGILLKQIDRDRHIALGNFYLRRFLRLSPAYWLVLALYALSGQANTHNLWANLLYVNNFLPYDQQAMNWSWSLAIEEQFYLVYPLLLTLVMRSSAQPERWLWGLFGLSFVLIALVLFTDDRLLHTPASHLATDPAYHAYHFSALYDNLYTRFGPLVCGALAAFYFFHHEQPVRRFLNGTAGKALALLAFAVAVAVLVTPVLDPRYDAWPWLGWLYEIFARNLFGAAVAFLILTCLEGSALSRVLNGVFANRVWYPLAQLSYSMYLVHVVPIAILVQVGVSAMQKNPRYMAYTHWQALAEISLYSFLLTVLLALVIYLLIERPVMNLRK